jgi:ABC-2 type transport system ATP-binding protein
MSDNEAEKKIMPYGIAIKTTNLSRNFGNLRAVDALNLSIPTGIIFGYLGPNGSGKTTTIRLLLGLLELSNGEAVVLGHNVRSHASEIRQVCGVLLEHHGLYERLTAEDNLEFYGRVYRIQKPDRKRRIQNLLEKLGLWDRRNDLVAEWSRGMKQKLAIARTLLHHPQLIFLDEPTSGLDPQSAASLRKDLAALADEEGVTVFLTTHNLAEAESLCQQVGVIRKGQLIAVGSPEELKSKRDQQRVEITGIGVTEALIQELRVRPEISFVAFKNGKLRIDYTLESAIAPAVSFLVSKGVQIEEVRKEKASLEDVFLTLMEEEL